MNSLNAPRCSVRHRFPRLAGTASVVVAVLLAPLTMPHVATAQAVTGVGDDAVPLPKGTFRFRVGGLWNNYTSVYAPDAKGSLKSRALFAPLATANFGTQALPQLSAAEAAIRTLTANTNYALSLGTFEAIGDVRQSTVPLALDVGITRRISIGIAVPYVESRNLSQLVLNRNGTSANVGQNPAFSTTLGTAARSTNGSLLRQIALARTQLAAEITRCADPLALNCTAIRANPAAAQSLLQQALGAQRAIATVYGDSLRGASPVVPVTGSTSNTAIVATIGSLRSAFQGFGVTSIAQTIAPAAATIVYGPGSLVAIAADSAFGLRYNAVGGTRRAGIGDVDLTVTALLHDSFNADQKRRLNNTGRAWRSTVTAGFRFGSAGADRVEDPLDVPIGDGASALLVRSTTDIIANRFFWVSGTVRLVKPFADNVAAALPLLTDSTIFFPFTVGSATRSLGQRIEIEIAPRLMLGQFFGVSSAYLLRRVGAARLQPLGNFGVPDCPVGPVCPQIVSQTTAATTVQALSIGASFSSLASYMRGGAKWPLELLFSHTAPISASGGIQPIFSTDRLELKIYRRFPRR